MNDICHDIEPSFFKKWKKDGLIWIDSLLAKQLRYELLIHQILSCFGEQGNIFISVSSAFVMADLLKGIHFEQR